MEYSLNVKVLEKLVDIEIKILESYRLMMVFNDVPRDDYNNNLFINELARLKVLVKKENILLEQLPQQSEILKYIYNMVCQNKNNFFDDEKTADLVLKRFENIMIDLVNLCEDKEEEEIFEDMEIDYDDIDRYSYRILIRDNLNKKNIVYLNDLMELYEKSLQDLFISTQVSLAYFYKNLGDELLKNDFDISKYEYYNDSDLAKLLKLSTEEYTSLKNNELYNMTQELFFEMMSCILDENNFDDNLSIIKDSLRFRFLLHEMPTSELVMFNEGASDIISDTANFDDLANEIKIIIEMEIKKRDDLPKKNIEDNVNCNPIDSKTAKGLIELIKIEEKLLSVFDSIDFDSIYSKEDIDNLSFLVNIEKECISNLNISNKTIDVVDNIFTNDIDFFFDSYLDEKENTRKKKLIYARLNSIIPFFQHLNLCPTQSEKSYLSINQNHLISAIKIYEEKINKNNDLLVNEAMKKFYKELFFVNGFLLDDLIFINGNYKMIDRFSDSIVAKNIGISDIEYSFDKDEQLYEQATDIVDSILNCEDVWEDDLSARALFEFKLSELSDIILNVSDEHIYSLLDIVNENKANKSPKSKRIIHKVMGIN